ncbi:hypothetical protein CONLIGDRAFT_688142 [Coniochaeta ligniaria NRRL 30616]|uniref:Uncharacterized protein n=1 Tax=Coniochaeta ligniaria NRRL 30616 TaxID=1408157 RepID=A0A1J7K2G4_9PEZI|nr:hypothetical protein CONLIGDRAFT_688142 [Coniochaeta ligniaria NRRL 30616]
MMLTMMLTTFYCLFNLAISSSFAYPDAHLVPAVAFSFAADYGTVALHLTNDSSVSLAKLAGTPGYKTFMRREQALPPDSWFCSIWGTCARNPDIDAANAMINALKSSAEEYFGTTFCFVSIAVPDARQTNYQREIFEAAINASGLRQPFSTQSAAKQAVFANQPEDIDMIPDQQIALAIEYSRAGLNLELFCDDGGILDSLRIDHNLGLGADDPDRAHWNAVLSALERISKPPFPNCPSWDSTVHKKINYIVLYGDSVKNTELLRVVARAVGEEVVAEARWWEPEFGIALSLARTSYSVQNSNDFEDRPAFGCRWRSGLYSGTAEL